jgi:DNA polymerase III sliding clamp (beta) subunit (PCNA family)
MPTDDFPALPTVQCEDIIMQGAHFLQGIGCVMHSCAIDDSAALLKGAHVRLLPEGSETRVEFAATDGHRLAVHRMRMHGRMCPEMISATVPRSTLLEVERLTRLAAKGSAPAAGSKGANGKNTDTIKREPAIDESPIAIRIDSEYAQFVLGPRKGVWTAVRVFSRLFDGIFPNYDELMPREYSRGALACVRVTELSACSAAHALLLRHTLNPKPKTLNPKP